MDQTTGTPEDDGGGGGGGGGLAPSAASGVSDQPRRPSRRWSKALVGVTAVVTAFLVGTHLLMTFLFNAPANTVNANKLATINGWMLPLFDQNWHLFAPDPYSENVDVKVRAKLSDGAVSGWIDLSAQDQAAEHNPVPSHVTVNALRNAYTDWANTHSEDGGTLSFTGPLAQEYLENLVVDRIKGEVGGTVGAVQLSITTTLIPGPGRTAKQTAPQTQTLDWWVVA